MQDSAVGKEVDGYRILEVLGRGGMGVVYKAEDVALSRTVALKRIDPGLANDDSFLRRFRSEARALARIDSAYITGVHALRQTEIGLLIVMEYVDGGTVKDLILEGPMDPAEALPVIKQMLLALEHAHGAGVIHRDIKPHNIMLSSQGVVKMTDFGLAKVHRPDSQRTVTQGVYGTLNYMSPEQVQGLADVGPRSDLYSLGMTIYEMLAGRLPFDEDSSEFAIMRSIVEDDVPRLTTLRADLPDALVSCVMKAVEKDPDDRYQSAQEMRRAFAAIEDDVGAKGGAAGVQSKAPSSSSSSNRTALIGAASAVLIGLLVAGYVLYDVLQPDGDTPSSSTSSANPVVETATELSIDTEPIGADVMLNGQFAGVTPLSRSLSGDSTTLRVQRAGYLPVDTTVQLAGRETATLYVQLTERAPATSTNDPPARPVEEPTASSDASQPSATAQNTQEDDPPAPATGTVQLGINPSGTILVDGTRRSSGSVELTAGTHRLTFRHPEYGTKDTTITVAAGATKALTCYFEHTINVLSEPWANVYVNGENTGQTTPYNEAIGPGTYQVGLRIRRGAFTIDGGVLRQRAGDRRLPESAFTGSETRITVAPAFEPRAYVLSFNVTGQGS